MFFLSAVFCYTGLLQGILDVGEEEKGSTQMPPLVSQNIRKKLY